MKTVQTKQNSNLLRTMYPSAYKCLIEKLQEHNIHSFDVQATARKKDAYVSVSVRFGERFGQEKIQDFPEKALHETDSDFAAFCEEVQKTCKEVLIADYFKMVKP
ncbi:hypothetical protein [Lentibacillus cibarius]|uniref:Uncharacterized protein n=1 Tax=Lentibacillus cibarius TaxID=2583219 RepID=A0A5S3QMW4_9BACI|nr:hypothetical protein [Lentibacillus cibarius]TMN23077.1 hypothetical protein FFL34_14010 [Lentibacillus cibarius]